MAQNSIISFYNQTTKNFISSVTSYLTHPVQTEKVSDVISVSWMSYIISWIQIHYGMNYSTHSLNIAIHSTIKESPHFVLFGQDKRLHHEFLFRTPQPIYNFGDYVKCKLHALQNSHRIIHDCLAAWQQEILSKQYLIATASILKIGDIVFHQQHDCHSKLDRISSMVLIASLKMLTGTNSRY